MSAVLYSLTYTMEYMIYYNMIAWILAGNGINFSIAAGLTGRHMLGVK